MSFIAQLVERSAVNREVRGSTPLEGDTQSIKNPIDKIYYNV